MSLCGEGDTSWVGHLTLLQVLHQLGQPALGGGVVLQDGGESGVFELIGEALTQSFTGPGYKYMSKKQILEDRWLQKDVRSD